MTNTQALRIDPRSDLLDVESSGLDQTTAKPQPRIEKSFDASAFNFRSGSTTCDINHHLSQGLMPSIQFPVQGQCGCGHVRYQLHRRPIFTQCCNCQQCQRESGSAFAINALVETEELTTTSDLQHIIMPSESGHGQAIARCPRCHVVVWSFYSSHGPHLKFLRVATLEGVEELLRPEAFIFTKFKMPWVEFPEFARKAGRVFDEYFDERSVYSRESFERFEAVEAKGLIWVEKGRKWSDLGVVEDLRSR